MLRWFHLIRRNKKYNHTGLYHHAETQKDREYKQRIIEVEHADFMPLVFTCAGGISPKNRLLLKRLPEMISEKQNIHVSQISGLLRVRLNFALLRTTVLCCRGTRKKKYNAEPGTKSDGNLLAVISANINN